MLSLVIKLFTKGNVIQNPNNKEYASLFLLIFITLYMGLRPISGKYFVDMGIYNSDFEKYASGEKIKPSVDFFWHSFMKFCSTIMSAKIFFLVCAILYVVPLYKAAKNWLGVNKYILFFMFIASFSFWAYGTNGIRNGIGTSIFVLAVSYTNKKYLSYFLLVISYLIHGSLVIPIAAYVLTLFYKNPLHYLLAWILSIPLSLAFGGYFESFFYSLGFEDSRISYLIQGNINNDDFAYTGFRLDFVMYSFTGIFAGYYFIIRKNFRNKIYIKLFNLYAITNVFWILVIRANFSNRFAYMSWFLITAVIFYPFLKAKFFKNQNKVLAYVILGYFSFTYFMFLIT
tara:strand:- start:7986 stop:9011 length:1026 start_codon:yes stop_codon:yes gene_type:complete